MSTFLEDPDYDLHFDGTILRRQLENLIKDVRRHLNQPSGSWDMRSRHILHDMEQTYSEMMCEGIHRDNINTWRGRISDLRLNALGQVYE